MRVSRLLASAQATTMLFGLKVGFPQLAGKTTLVALPAVIARGTTRGPASGSTLRITDRDMRRLLGGWSDPIRWRGGNFKPLNIRTICEHAFVRWDNLIEQQQRYLPGYRDPAVVRTFDAPEALGTRFYEVRAKSALNRVPKQSRMPFRWTINPYRGCAHACAYCQAGETPILMADGRTKQLGDLEVGDRIYGTVRDGHYRRYVTTEVLDRWISIKPAYRITLEDGTELVSSGDHRFLSDRGWKHVVHNARAPDRAHLTTNNKLIGTGAFADGPRDAADYRTGYLCGMIRANGLPRSRHYLR